MPNESSRGCSRHRIALIAFLLVLVAAVPVTPARAADGADAASAPPRPKLVVLLVIDQFRPDYLERWRDLFGDGGFKRLMGEGAYYPEARYSHGSTATGPGHASVSTGCNPRQNGIAGNKDRRGECSGDPAYATVGTGGATAGGDGGSAAKLRAPTLGDLLKQRSPDGGRVFSIALKRRAAVLLAGQKADLALWWDAKSGDFVSSRAFVEKLPAFVEQINGPQRGEFADRFFKLAWERAAPDSAYGRCAPDDDPVELDIAGMGRAFPHPMSAGLKKPGKRYYEAVLTSPFGNELVFSVAARMIEEQRLGRGPACDLLCIGLSSNDAIGHTFGPESHEVLDVTIRTDRQIADLLSRLDRLVGRDKYTLALTSDHGVAPVAARSKSAGRDAGLVSEDGAAQSLNAALQRELAAGDDSFKPVLGIGLPWVYLDRAAVAARSLDAAAVTAACAKAAARLPGVGVVFTDAQLAVAAPPGDDPQSALRLAWETYHPDSAGEIYLGLSPYWHEDGNAANHGTSNEYDRRVPIVLYGCGVHAGRYSVNVDPIQIAPTLAAIIGIPPATTMCRNLLDEALAAQVSRTP